MSRPTRFIFLDIDGVLINRSCFYPGAPGGEDRKPDPACVAALNRITDETHAGIVVSSTWRIAGLMFMRELLAKWGVKAPVVGTTPYLTTAHGDIRISAPRGREITAWLARYPHEVESFVILDDDSDMAHLEPHLIQTQFENGLTMAHADRAVSLLEMRP